MDNNLADLFPHIAAEWDWNSNTNNPNEYTPHSNKVVWWICPQGHSWQAKINNRVTNNTGCPYCAGKKPIVGENDLETLYPEIAKEWHPTKNGDAIPSQFLPKSNLIKWWRCKNGHEWQSRIDHRVEGRPCPYCSGYYVIPGVNDLVTTHPTLGKCWDYDKNDISPTNCKAGSHLTVWWKCPEGHEWQAKICSVVNSYNLNSARVGCPICSGKKVTEETCLSTVAPTLADEWNYDKNAKLSPNDFTLHSNQAVWWKCRSCGHVWKARINNRANGCGCPVCQHHMVSDSNNLYAVNPALASEWDYERNFPMTPDKVAVSSNVSYWWKCSEGHHWRTIVSNRSILGKGCPYCARRKPIPGKTDLLTLNPILAKQWHPTKNFPLRPDMVSPTSNRKVWWKCENGHEWQAIVFFRNRGSECPYCMDRKNYRGRFCGSND